jgi:hypothetical protein
MACPRYPEYQPPAIPWPTDYDDQDPKHGKRSPVLAASIAGFVAVLVIKRSCLPDSPSAEPAFRPPTAPWRGVRVADSIATTVTPN